MKRGVVDAHEEAKILKFYNSIYFMLKTLALKRVHFKKRVDTKEEIIANLNIHEFRFGVFFLIHLFYFLLIH